MNLGKIIGKGTERICYENLDNPETCLKISDKNNCVQTIREIRYFKFLAKKGIHPSFLPKFYRSFETPDKIGFEQEYLKSTNEFQAVSLKTYIRESDFYQLQQVEQSLNEIKALMIQFNVIISDLRTGNTLLLVNKQRKILRLIFIDGFGSPEFIPLPIYCPFFGKLKIERQWKKFMKKYNEEKISRIRELNTSQS